MSEALAKIPSTRQYRETLSVPARHELTLISNRIRECTSQLRVGIIQVASYLLEAKELVGHGHWGVYVAAECGGISLDTADRLVLVAQLVKKQELTAEEASRLSKCTLYSLVSVNTPLPVKRDIIQSARDGVPVRHKQVQEMIRASKPVEPKANSSWDKLARACEVGVSIASNESLKAHLRIAAEHFESLSTGKLAVSEGKRCLCSTRVIDGKKFLAQQPGCPTHGLGAGPVASSLDGRSISGKGVMS